MRTFIILALASMAIAACSYHRETVERPAGPGQRAVVTDSASVGPSTMIVHDSD